MKTNLTRPIAAGTLPGRRILLPGLMLAVFAFLLVCGVLSCKKNSVPPEASGPATKNQDAKLKTSGLPGTDFMIVVMPDIQYETGNKNGATPAMLTSQINWIKAHKADSNIVYVLGLGDITDDGDNPARTDEWVTAKNNYYALDTAGIPYGLAIGNHDQYPNQGYPITDATSQYNTYFGTSHFTGKSYYGGHYTGGSGANDSHYDLFSAAGLDWIVIYIEYDSQNQDRTNMNTWAYNLLGTYASRKAIIVTHYFIDNNATTGNANGWGNSGGVNPTNSQGKGIYDKLKTRRNVFLFLSGHVGGEGYRQDTYQGRTIKTMLADYQFMTNGGSGFMRLMHFSRDNDRIQVRTYSPYANAYNYGQFVKTLFHEPILTRSCDFDNNGKSNLSFFNAGVWKVSGLSNVTQGTSGDIPAYADYDGDGKTDYVYFRPSNNSWNNIPGLASQSYGTSGDVPIPADFDGDGKADLAVFRPGTNTTFYWRLNGVSNSLTYGVSGDVPIIGDYNGDGKADPAVFRPSNKTFYMYYSGASHSAPYGSIGDIPVPGDYNGDGITDVAVYRPSTGTWFVKGVDDTGTVWGGQAGDIPCPGDYFGDGKTHYAYYRGGTLYVNGGTNITLGSSGDKILNLPYSIRSVYFP